MCSEQCVINKVSNVSLSLRTFLCGPGRFPGVMAISVPQCSALQTELLR